MVEPLTASRPNPHESVPKPWREDYVEAAAIISFSPKSSAALLRRIVDGMLREVTTPASLHNMIEAVKPPKLPDFVWSGLHDLREFGNWSAHPQWTDAGEIVQIEDHEVEMCFDVVDQMFDHWYVAPWREEQRRKRVEARKAAGINKKP